MSKRLLFVDDDPLVLMAFERLLHPFRSLWNMEFSPDGRAALEALRERSFDVIVTDMKMPDVSGVELLEHVKRNHPRMLRIALSGQSDRESMLRAATIAHYYLAKPCEPGTLVATLQRAFALQDKLSSASLNEILGKIDRLPSAPSVYTQLVEAMQSPACNILLVSTIVEQDVAIASKLLQIANSPLFGFRYQVSNPAHAVSLLGVDAVKSLVLSLGVFSQFEGDPATASEIATLFEHSIVASRAARRIAELVGLDRHTIEDCFTAGLLHEVGQLVLTAQVPEQWKRITQIAQAENLTLSEAEKRVLACNRDEIGAYMLELWCLPSAIVEAVAWRSHPSDSPVEKMGPLAVLHLADAACAQAGAQHESVELDRAFLLRCGIDEQIETLMAECQNLASQGKSK